MPSESITYRYPTGAWEYGFMERTPELGDNVVRQGRTWVVVAVTESMDDNHVITMALAPDVMDHERSGLSPW